VEKHQRVAAALVLKYEIHAIEPDISGRHDPLLSLRLARQILATVSMPTP
jgi:hypothetical protein